MKINDGTGGGHDARVDINKHLNTRSFTNDMAHWVSKEKGQAYIWTGDTYNYDAADTILLLRNDATDKNLIITDIWIRGDTETDADIHFTSGAAFTPTGTAVTGVNLNRNSTNTAEATCIRDETANTQGNVFLALRISADTEYHVDTKGMVILGYHNSIGVDFVTDGGEAYVSIAGYYEDK